MSPPGPRERLLALSDDEWRALLWAACRRARWRFAELSRGLPWVPADKDPEDFVYDLQSDLLSDEPRNHWNPDRGGLLWFVHMAVEGNIRLFLAPDRPEVRLFTGEEDLPPSRPPKTGSSPESDLVRHERDGYADRLYEQFRRHLARWPRLLPIFELRLDGLWPRQIATRLGISEEEANARNSDMMRKLRNKFRKAVDWDLLLGGDR